jgi:predicted AAA+ superfamily ATPase
MLPLIFDTCVPRDEILSGDLSLDLFAAKLLLLVEGTAPQVDRDANKLFANTFATDGIKTLIREVFSRLISKTERIANIAEVIMVMSNEEARYWFGNCQG